MVICRHDVRRADRGVQPAERGAGRQQAQPAATPPASNWALSQSTRSSARNVSRRCSSLASIDRGDRRGQRGRRGSPGRPARRRGRRRAAWRRRRRARSGRTGRTRRPAGAAPGTAGHPPARCRACDTSPRNSAAAGRQRAAGTGRSRGSSRIARSSAVKAPLGANRCHAQNMPGHSDSSPCRLITIGAAAPGRRRRDRRVGAPA